MKPERFDPGSDPARGRIDEIMNRIAHYEKERANGEEIDLDKLREEGVLSQDDLDFLEENGVRFKLPEELDLLSWRIDEILGKIRRYQEERTNGRAAELDELRAQGILSPEDLEFLQTKKIKYKPHASGSPHAGDMFEIPTAKGCMFTGPGGPEPPHWRIELKNLPVVIERYLKNPEVNGDVVPFGIHLSEYDGIGLAPGFLMFNFRDERYRSLVPAIKQICEEHGLKPIQDSPDLQRSYILSYLAPKEPGQIVSVMMDILTRAFGLSDTDKVIYQSFISASEDPPSKYRTEPSGSQS